MTCTYCHGAQMVPSAIPLGPELKPCPQCDGTGKAKPPAHECRHGGGWWEPIGPSNVEFHGCGDNGRLCDRCKLDAAGRLVEMVCKSLDRIYTEMK
jgi:hypothetical protein